MARLDGRPLYIKTSQSKSYRSQLEPRIDARRAVSELALSANSGHTHLQTDRPIAVITLPRWQLVAKAGGTCDHNWRTGQRE
jgi:hypothetical protein